MQWNCSGRRNKWKLWDKLDFTKLFHQFYFLFKLWVEFIDSFNTHFVLFWCFSAPVNETLTNAVFRAEFRYRQVR